MLSNSFPNILWNPHQKLWNARLIRQINSYTWNKEIKDRIVSNIIFLDTLIWRLKTWIKFFSIKTLAGYEHFTLNYFDLGTHRNARELIFFVNDVLQHFNCDCNIYAFEACRSFFEEAKEKTIEIKNIRFFNLALCNDFPDSGKIRLYYFGENGLGNSIYRFNDHTFEDVDAKKISDVIRENNISLENSVNILRMNIEGAEFDVITDLINSDLIKYFHGLYGMWDDIWKIDPQKDIEFRKMLDKAKIRTFPFNGRDMDRIIRLKMIKENMTKMIIHEIKKMQKLHLHKAF